MYAALIKVMHCYGPFKEVNAYGFVDVILWVGQFVRLPMCQSPTTCATLYLFTIEPIFVYREKGRDLTQSDPEIILHDILIIIDSKFFQKKIDKPFSKLKI